MSPANPQLPPRGRISSSFDGISAGLGTAEVIGIVGAIILAVVIVVLVCVIHSKKNKSKEDLEDEEKNARIDAWSGSNMPAGELRRDEEYERELRRGGGTTGQGEQETVGLLPVQGPRRGDEVEFLPGPRIMEGAVVRQ